MVPCYSAMIAEDDPHFLAMMHAETEVPLLRARVVALEQALANKRT